MPVCTDLELCKLAEALHALSLSVKAAASGPGVLDSEMTDVLAHLNITPGRPAHPAAIKAAEEWAKLEEQDEIAKALAQDANDVLIEKVNNTFVEDEEDISLSDDELEPDSIEHDDRRGAPKNSAPPSYAELCSYFGPLEEYAEACGIREVGYLLRRAKMGFLAASRYAGTAVGHQIVHLIIADFFR